MPASSASDRRPRRSRRSSTTKDAYFVQVAGEEAPQFFDLTDRIGRPMPFSKPLATVAMRVTDDTIAVSLLLLTKRVASSVASSDVEMPVGPIARLLRKVKSADEPQVGQLLVEHDGGLVPFRLDRDSAGIVTVTDVDDDPTLFELPKGGPKLTMYLKSPATGRTLAVSSMGARYPGKPGTVESLARAVSMVLFTLTQLMEFRVLAGFETVDVPPPVARSGGSGMFTSPDVDLDAASRDVPVWLFDGTPPTPVASGTVTVSVDLRRANPATGKLLVHLEPDASIAEKFPPFHTQMERSVLHVLQTEMGDTELNDICYDVVLGSVDRGAVERLGEALETIAAGMDLTTGQYRLHNT